MIQYDSKQPSQDWKKVPGDPFHGMGRIVLEVPRIGRALMVGNQHFFVLPL